MRYCINPNCNDKIGSLDGKLCLLCGTSLLLENRYEVLSQISNFRHDHPFEVFRVRDTKSGKDMILKTSIEYHDSTNPEMLRALGFEEDRGGEIAIAILNKCVELFKREKEILKKSIGYDGTPDLVIDFPMDGDGTRPYMSCLVMELIEGEDLNKWIKREKKLTDRQLAINWIKKLANIIDNLHSKGLFHRDIKPSNIIKREQNGNLVLIDFGSTAEINAGGKRTMVGSALYSAPEQIRNGSFYHQSDFFALGKTFVHLLTGAIPNKCLIEVDEWQYDTELRETGIIPLIDWLLRENHLQRPQTGGEILRVIHYISERKADGVFPNDEDTRKFILSIQQPSTTQAPVTTQGEIVTPPTERSLVNGGPKKDPYVPGITTAAESKYLSKVGISIAVLTGIAALLIYCRRPPENAVPDPQPTSPVAPLPAVPIISPPNSIENLISFGDRYIKIYESNITESSQSAAFNLFNGVNPVNPVNPDYKKAYEAFYKLHMTDKKNPAFLIYMNNAKVRFWQKYWQGKKKKEVYTIAAPLPTERERGRQMLYGIAHAQSKAINQNLFEKPTINTSDPNEEPKIYLEVGIVNDYNNESQAEATAKYLVQESITGLDRQKRQILSIVGHYASEVTCKALPEYAKKLLIISPTSTLEALRNNCGDNDPNTPVFYRTASSSKDEFEKLAQHLRAQNIEKLKIFVFYKKQKKVVIDEKTKKLSNTTEFSQDMYDIFGRSELTAHQIGEFDLSNDLSKIDSEQVKIIKSANAIILFPNGKTNTADVFNRSFEVLGMLNSQQTKVVLASNPMFTSEKYNMLKGWGQKLVVAVDWYGVGNNNPKSCGNKTYIDESVKLWGGDLNRTTAQSYEAAQVLSSIFESFKSTHATRQAILEKIKTVYIPSDVFPTKRISFDNDGNRLELRKRILLTPSSDGKKFSPILGEKCN
jgi:serine/threonine protein kinase